jgi:hypothetical protein
MRLDILLLFLLIRFRISKLCFFHEIEEEFNNYGSEC